MKCKVCNKEIGHGQRYKTETLTSVYFCSKECYENYLARPKTKPKTKPKTDYKPKPGSQRRRFTDYLQDWTDDRINWPMAMKQAKDIQEEYELSWHDMLMVLKYAREYDNYTWDLNYGLYQVFPKYIKPTQDFVDSINKNKNTEVPEEETYVVKRKRNYTGKVEW